LDLPVTSPAAPGQPATLNVPLASLPVGEFLIELSVQGGDGSQSTELVAFRMIG